MGKVTVQTLPTNKPGNSLAIWLAANHPDLFVTLYKQAKARKVAKKVQLQGIRGLSQDEGITTTFDDPGTFDPSSVDTSGSSPDTSGSSLFDTSGSDIGPLALSESDLQPVSIDDTSLEALSPNLLTSSNSAGASALTNLGTTPTSSGQTVAAATGGATTNGFLSALGNVGSFIASAPGLTALTGLATAVVGGMQAHVIQTQAARTQANQTVAPITYTRDAYGNVVPVYATQTPAGAIYQPLSPQGISALSPSNIEVMLTQYGPYIFVGGLALVAFNILRR